MASRSPPEHPTTPLIRAHWPTPNAPAGRVTASAAVGDNRTASMSPRLRRCALAFVFVLLTLPVLASPPPREDRRAARTRTARPVLAAEPEPAEVQPAEAAPLAAAAADAGGIELAGLLGMLTAISASFIYARGRRLSGGVAARSRPSPGLEPLDPP